MSGGGSMPSSQSTSPATGATGSSPTTSQPMQSFQSPAGGKGGYPAPQQVNPFASQYQPMQQMRQVDDGGMGRMRQFGRPQFSPEGMQVMQQYGFSPDSLEMAPYRRQQQGAPDFRYQTYGPESLKYRSFLEQPISPEVPLRSSGLAGLMGGLERPQEQKIYPQVLPPEPKPE